MEKKTVSFMRSLCMGQIEEDVILPFLVLSESERETLQTVVSSVGQLMDSHSKDFRAWDEKAELPPEFIDELLRAARQLVAEARDAGLPPEAIDESAIEARLDTASLPPLDLLIRTSGECRLSNFLLWQAAYAELLFVDTLWPDFDDQSLADAVAVFAARERRYGGR